MPSLSAVLNLIRPIGSTSSSFDTTVVGGLDARANTASPKPYAADAALSRQIFTSMTSYDYRLNLRL
jgi:hypothetical protein